MSHAKVTSLDQVRRDELTAIEERRRAAKLEPPGALKGESGKNDLVGLAFSGGGMRSASFCLGIVQVFLYRGVWRWIDYLSTVSGGGYVAAFLASHLVRCKKPFGPNHCPLLANSTAQPPDIQRFIYGGRFLFRPWELANKYFIGLVLLNASLMSLIAMAAVLAAFLWRCLDTDIVRDYGTLLGLRGDLIYALIPFLTCILLWLTAWIVSYFRRGAEAPGRAARVCLIASLISLAVGGAILLGNGDIDVSMFSNSTKPQTWNPNKGFIATLITITLTALVPFFAPQRLIQSGLHPKNHWEQWLFALASFAALAGIPLLLVGFFAHENISGYNTNPYRPVCAGDIERVASLVKLLWPTDQLGDDLLWHDDVQSSPASAGTASGIPAPRQAGMMPLIDAAVRYSVRKVSRAVFEASPDADALSATTIADAKAFRADQTFRRLFLSNEKVAVGELSRRLNSADQRRLGKELTSFRAKVRDALRQTPTNRGKNLRQLHDEVRRDLAGDGDSLLLGRLKLILMLNDVNRAQWVRFEQFHGLNRDRDSSELLTQRIIKISLALSFFSGLYDDENDAAELYALIRVRRALLEETTGIINRDVLNYSLLELSEGAIPTDESRNRTTRALELFERLRDARVVATSTTAPSDTRAKSDSTVKSDGSMSPSVSDPTDYSDDTQLVPLTSIQKRRLDYLLIHARMHDSHQLPASEIFEANVLMLSERLNGVFRPRSAIRRAVTAGRDQKYRLWILGGLLAFFIVAGVWVDANATSMHRYYRTRLAQAFIVPPHAKSESPLLTQLDRATEVGAPYFLIHGSSGLLIDRTGNEQLTADDPVFQHQTPNFQPIDSFLLSSKYCGSDSLGYVPTKEYESRVCGDESQLMLSEAIAISGAAVSPGQIPNKLLAFLMFMLNLRLGQWMPNPARPAPRWRPRVLPLLLSQCRLPRDRSYCFVTDGGNSDNLGLLALLRRRCRLIVQIDVGHDPGHELADLARVLRLARVHDGIRLADLMDETAEFSIDDLRLDDVTSGQGKCRRHWVVARILYPESDSNEDPPNGKATTRRVGTLVLVKPSFTGDEPLDLMQYRHANKTYPHEPTSDQAYEPEQVESYRQLGWHIADELWRDLLAPEGADGHPLGQAWDESAEKTELICERIEQRWRNVSTPGAAMGRNKQPPVTSDRQPVD